MLFALKGTNSIHSYDKKAVIHKNKERKEEGDGRQEPERYVTIQEEQTDEEENKTSAEQNNKVQSGGQRLSELCWRELSQS